MELRCIQLSVGKGEINNEHRRVNSIRFQVTKRQHVKPEKQHLKLQD